MLARQSCVVVRLSMVFYEGLNSEVVEVCLLHRLRGALACSYVRSIGREKKSVGLQLHVEHCGLPSCTCLHSALVSYQHKLRHLCVCFLACTTTPSALPRDMRQEAKLGACSLWCCGAWLATKKRNKNVNVDLKILGLAMQVAWQDVSRFQVTTASLSWA